MVALQPDLEEVAEPAVGGDVLRRKMTVVVQNRLGGRKLVIKATRRGGGQEKVFVDERHDRNKIVSQVAIKW
jgi:hypothetical protein